MGLSQPVGTSQSVIIGADLHDSTDTAPFSSDQNTEGEGGVEEEEEEEEVDDSDNEMFDDSLSDFFFLFSI